MLEVFFVVCPAKAEHPVFRGPDLPSQRFVILDHPVEPVIRPADGRTG
jgi:hypothetical protein